MSNTIKGEHICFTGKMEKGDRDEMKAQARDLGAIVQSDVNSKTDILVHGAEFMFLTKNLGGNVSVNNYIPNNVYESLGESSLQFGDIDLDGDLDLFWIGLKNSRNTITNKLVINKSNYQENVDWEFDESMVMPDLRSGAIAWSDIDLDGDLDLLTSGQQLTVESGATKLYLNDPIGRLGETTTQDIAALKGTAICFSDLDNDADDDLIISGYSPIDSSLKTLIYVNEPTGNFRLANEQIDFGTIFGTIERSYRIKVLWKQRSFNRI